MSVNSSLPYKSSVPILVTGGAGLIGSAVVWRLNQLGYENISVVDHLGESDKWRNLSALRFVNYLEKDQLFDFLERGGPKAKFDLIFHLGACSSTTEADASYLAKNNFDYSRRLAEYAIRQGSRMVYASSAATYGDGALGFDDDEAQALQLRPLNMYGYSKQLMDQYLLQRGLFGEKNPGGASFVGLKYSNVFGPNEYHKAHMRSMVLRAYEQIMSEGKVRLFKSYKAEYEHGMQLRDFLYVKDAADMSCFFIAEGRHCRGLYNIGYGKTRSWLDLAEAMFAALDKESNIEFIDMPEELKEKYQYYTCLNMDKLRKAGYHKPLSSLELAVKDYARYLQKKAHLGDLE